MVSHSLTPSEREFLSRITRVMLANPFSDAQRTADGEIDAAGLSTSYDDRLKLVIQEIMNKVGKLISVRGRTLQKFSGRDRTLIENGLRVYAYLQTYPLFDQLIQEQIMAGDAPCSVPFAKDAIATITKLGFPKEEAVHSFATFFQMRRAYYFIKNSIIGRSQCMKQQRQDLWDNVFTRDLMLYSRCLWNRMEDYSTLLLGETGTGKGIAAVSIGRSGYIPFDEKKGRFTESFTRAFVSLNLSQYPEQLIESELFGHRKGSFTGAFADHEGVFSRCSPHGAIFLDEIGEVSIPVQIKLLQVLQDRVFSPVGNHEKKRFQGRVIAATNRSIHTLRSEGIFREDFYYRLCSDVISVPPLRQRIQEDPGELDDLIEHMLNRIVGEPSPGLFERVRTAIQKQVPSDYPWPGNVRELEQCIRRILLKHSYQIDRVSIAPKDIPEQVMTGMKEGTMDAQQVLSGYCKILYDTYGTYEEVARRSGLDSRTVKKYLGLYEMVNSKR